MTLWYFSSSVNSFFNAHAQPPSGARCLGFGRTLRLLPYCMYAANSEGSGETARMRRLAWAFAGRLCEKYQNLMSWLITVYFKSGQMHDCWSRDSWFPIHVGAFFLLFAMFLLFCFSDSSKHWNKYRYGNIFWIHIILILYFLETKSLCKETFSLYRQPYKFRCDLF